MREVRACVTGWLVGGLAGSESGTHIHNAVCHVVSQAGDILNMMIFDFLLDNHDRGGNCFVVGTELVALDQSNGNFEMDPKPNRQGPPHLRIRPDIERPKITKDQA